MVFRAKKDPASAASSGREPRDAVRTVVRDTIRTRYGRNGAGDGNRTHVTSLEGWNSTIELHPRFENRSYFSIASSACQPFLPVARFFCAAAARVGGSRPAAYFRLFRRSLVPHYAQIFQHLAEKGHLLQDFRLGAFFKVRSCGKMKRKKRGAGGHLFKTAPL